MTIDEALNYLYTYSDTNGSGQTTQAQHEEAKRVAIDTMQKYQKIKEIVKAWNDMNSFDSMAQISEVLEDGNDK